MTLTITNLGTVYIEYYLFTLLKSTDIGTFEFQRRVVRENPQTTRVTVNLRCYKSNSVHLNPTDS